MNQRRTSGTKKNTRRSLCIVLIRDCGGCTHCGGRTIRHDDRDDANDK
ncbi:hypothetical protein [Corynebacterium propinquum]